MNRRKFVGILAALPGLRFLKLDLKLKPKTQGTLPPPIGWPPERCEFVYDGSMYEKIIDLYKKEIDLSLKKSWEVLERWYE